MDGVVEDSGKRVTGLYGSEGYRRWLFSFGSPGWLFR